MCEQVVEGQGPAVPAPGQILDSRYKLIRRIGKGGMGVVFLAEDTRLAKKVAIKFVRTDRADQSDYQKKLLKEARCSARISHENIAKILDVSPDGAPTSYIVFEFVEGVTVATLLEKRGRLPLEDAVDIVLDVCAGLAEAHRAGVIHRDLKPENLILSERADGSNNVKIVDFGVARAEPTLGESQATATDSAGARSACAIQVRAQAELRLLGSNFLFR